MYKLLCVTVLLLTFCLGERVDAQQTLVDSTINNLKTAVQGFKDRYHSPAIAVAIIKDQDIIFSDAIGYTDIGNKTPVTINSKFPIMSVTKTFTATMYMQLYQQKKINLLDDVVKYVPEFAGKTEPFLKKGTSLFQLATHTAGLPRNSPADVSFAKQVDLWMLIKATYLTFEPATKQQLLKSLQHVRKEYPDYDLLSYGDRHYSNLGYSVLGIAVERAAKTGYANYITNNILKPLKMGNTGFDSDKAGRDALAKGYYYDEDKKDFMQTPVFNSNSALYAGGMYSTVVDLAKYVSFQFSESKQDAAVLSPENKTMMYTLRIGWKPDYPYVLHEGAIVGYRSQVIFNPGLKLGWVILTNANDFEFGVINSYFHKQLQPLFKKTAIAGLEKYVGTYVLEGGYDSLTIAMKNDGLYSTYLQTADSNPPLVLSGANRFKGTTKGKYSVGYEFVADEEGEIQFLNVGQLLWVKKK